MNALTIKDFFKLNKNTVRKQWEFTPNDNVKSTSYTMAFFEADNEPDAWIILFLTVKKSPEFSINK